MGSNSQVNRTKPLGATTVDDRANIDIMINKFYDDRYVQRPVQSTQRSDATLRE